MNKDLTVGNPQTVLWKFCMPLFSSYIILPTAWSPENLLVRMHWRRLETVMKSH